MTASILKQNLNTYKRFNRTLFIGQKHSLQIFRDATVLPSTGQENNIAQPKKVLFGFSPYS